MTALIDPNDNLDSLAQATCCGDGSYEFVLILGGYLVAIILMAAPFQYWIYKRPGSLMATFFKGGLYLLGTLLLVFFAGLMYELADEVSTKGPVIAVLYAFIFSSYFLVTWNLSKFKKLSKPLLVKILVTLFVMQILVQIEMRGRFLSQFLYL